MSKSLTRASTLALLLLALSTPRAHGATVSLLDQFDDGSLASNTGIGGIGTGWTTDFIDCGSGWGVSASEADGKVGVTGGSCVHWIESNDGIDPAGTTLIWSIDHLTSGVLVGWVQAGKDACCETGVYLTIEPHRLVFDITAKSSNDPFQPEGRYFEILAGSTVDGEVYPGYVSAPGPGTGPLTAILYLDYMGWRISLKGEGVDVVKSGTYSSCPNPSSGQCISLWDVVTYPGVNGVLRPVAGAGREQQSAQFGSVLVTSVPVGVP